MPDAQLKKIGMLIFSVSRVMQTKIPNFDNPYFRVASVSNRLLMANRDIRQIYDKQWTVTVVDEVLIIITSETEVVLPY